MDKPKNNIEFHVIRIRELEFQYFVPPKLKQIRENRKDPNEEDKFFIDTSINYKWNIEKKIFGVEVTVSFSIYVEENSKEKVLRYSNITEFKVDDLKNILTPKEKGEFDMDRSYELTFVGIAISSCRGMMASRTTGTFYENHIFPVVNPNDFLVSNKFRTNNQNTN